MPAVSPAPDVLTSRPWRLSDRARVAFDVVLATALLLPAALYTPYGNWWPSLLSVLQTLPIFVRRKHPVATFGAIAALSALQAATYSYPVWGQVAFPVALYSLARYGRPLLGWVGLGVGLVGAVVASIVWIYSLEQQNPVAYRETITPLNVLPYLLTISAIVVASWALGTQVRTRIAYVATLVERGERLAAEAEQRAVLAATQERTRIAREMHDVVAHGLSIVIVQADGARYAAERDPAVAVSTLGTIADVGRSSLEEMRRLLGLLRGTSPAATAPQPGLADLSALFDDTVEVHVDDPLPAVSDGVALTLYRIAQESLTNVRKHAGAEATATVRLSDVGGTVELEVTDDGRGIAQAPGHGLGLVGMRERVEIHDGTIEAGPAPGGGWRVRARIPL